MKYDDKIASIRSNHGTKFENVRFNQFCNELGINHNFLSPRTPQQNGAMERKNRTLVDIGRTMLIDAGIAHNFWAEAINTTCYVTNKCLVRSILNKKTYELLTKKKPNMNYFKPFSCKCFVLNNGKEDLEKFNRRSDEGIFVGY